MFNRILVGTDGSGTASAAVRHAVELAQGTGAELLVLSVYLPPREGAAPFTTPDHAVGIDVARGLLTDVERHYGDQVKLRTVIKEGPPADAIIDVAEQEDVDLIIVGNKGMSGAKRFVLGSVPNTVSHHAPCNVLIVHTTEE